MREQAFQNALWLALRTEVPEARVWRQPAGRHRVWRRAEKSQSWITCAPVGAADLSGIVAPEGWRLEVEVKGAATRSTPAQEHWAKFIRSKGGIALTVRYVESQSLADNVARGCAEIRAAIGARRGTP